jgi:hypothetical protein
MDYATLDRATFLRENIEATLTALNEIENIPSFPGRFSSLVEGDGFSWLVICKHKDGSGFNANLFRGEGNAQLLKVITTELHRQLDEMNKELESL